MVASSQTPSCPRLLLKSPLLFLPKQRCHRPGLSLLLHTTHRCQKHQRSSSSPTAPGSRPRNRTCLSLALSRPRARARRAAPTEPLRSLGRALSTLPAVPQPWRSPPTQNPLFPSSLPSLTAPRFPVTAGPLGRASPPARSA